MTTLRTMLDTWFGLTHFNAGFTNRLTSHWFIGPCLSFAITLAILTTGFVASWHIINFPDGAAGTRQQGIQPTEYYLLLTQLDAVPVIPSKIRDSFADHIITNDEYDRAQELLRQNPLHPTKSRMKQLLEQTPQPGLAN